MILATASVQQQIMIYSGDILLFFQRGAIESETHVHIFAVVPFTLFIKKKNQK